MWFMFVLLTGRPFESMSRSRKCDWQGTNTTKYRQNLAGNAGPQRYGSCTHLQRHVILWQWQVSDEKSNSRRRREKLANMAAQCFRKMNFEDRGANSFFIFSFCGQLLRICVSHYPQIRSAITKKLIAVANLQIWRRNFMEAYIWVF